MPLSNILLVRGRSDDASWIESIGVASIGTYVFYPIDRLGTWSEKKRDYVGKIPKLGGGVRPKPTPYFSLFFPIQGFIKWQKNSKKI